MMTQHNRFPTAETINFIYPIYHQSHLLPWDSFYTI